MPVYDLIVYSVSDSEREVLDRIYSILDENKVDARLAHRTILTISEAYTNAFIHGNRQLPEKRISIHLDINDYRIVADISDEGTGGMENIRQIVPPSLLAEGGRGVALMRHYADEVQFEESATGGIIVSVTINRKIRQNV